MNDFNTWLAELSSDQRWYETMQMMHKNKNFKAGCEKLYGQMVSDSDLFKRPVTEQRKHLHNILGQMPIEKVQWWKVENKPVEKEKEEWKPVSWEERAEWLKKYQKAVDEACDNMTNRKPFLKGQDEAEGDVRPRKPVSTGHPPTPAEVLIQKQLHMQWIRENFDAKTAQPLPTFMKEDEWLAVNYPSDSQSIDTK